ncbi:syntaxin-binding protein 5-like [Tachypleus tridentatus]|uniref:syntaxin-binding protein 5-like n=1 Tax=Tachypleus tridentatus TaxID=6853 RepID=UPI003FCF3568
MESRPSAMRCYIVMFPLQFLYKLKSSKIFEQPKTENTDYQEDEPFAIEQIFLCSESRILCIAGASSHVVMFTFNQQETDCQVTVLEIPIVYEVDDDPECSLQPVSEQGTYSSAFEESAKQEPTAEYYVPLKVKSSSHKRHAGFQAELVCLTPWVDGEIPGHITALSVNSSYGLMAYGNECGLVVVDLIQKTCLLNMGTPDLYGSADPYRRVARSPKRNNTVAATDIRSLEHDSCCSPSPDQTTPTSLSDQSCLAGLFEKIDSSFSWSRSSSVSSLENVSAEVVQWLCFADSFSNRSDPTTSPSLWVGTSLGSILVILLTFPSDCDHRLTHPVIVSPSGTIYRLKESIVSLAFLDGNGALIPYPSGFWKDVDCNTKDSCDQATTIVDNISKNTNLLTPLPSEVCGNQFVVMFKLPHCRLRYESGYSVFFYFFGVRYRKSKTWHTGSTENIQERKKHKPLVTNNMESEEKISSICTTILRPQKKGCEVDRGLRSSIVKICSANHVATLNQVGVSINHVATLNQVGIGINHVATLNQVGMGINHVATLNQVGMSINHVAILNQVGLGINHVDTLNQVGMGINHVDTLNQVCLGINHVDTLNQVCLGINHVATLNQVGIDPWWRDVDKIQLHQETGNSTAFVEPDKKNIF